LNSDDSEEEESWLRHVARVSEVPAAVELPRCGDVIDGEYRIEELLGRGGMGAVFRATPVSSGTPVAIKWMLRPASDEQARRRFVREAQAAGRIDHPNVVTLLEVREAGDRIYLVMEFLRGESLRARLARGRLDVSAAIELIVPAMNGIAAAHQAGVVHRDLKPDNIFLCQAPDGSPLEAKVLDFGVSSIMAGLGNSTLTQAGALLGSPAYMSPEQIKNPHNVDHRTDVYALGVTLYEMLAGFRPFQGEHHAALITAIQTQEPKPLSRARAGLPPGLEAVVLRALSRDPAKRHQTMPSLIDALCPFTR
jgi:serine/threonine-protein kinase